MKTGLVLVASFLGFLWTAPVWAVNPDEMLADPVLEKRAREISKVLRCLVCQNQSIDDSDAALAKDLRIIVRQRLTAGDSDGAVIDYVVARYGDFVLLKPPFKGATLVLWLGPAVIAGLGLWAMIVFLRRHSGHGGGPGDRQGGGTQAATGAKAASRPRPPTLTDDEKKKLEKLLKEDGS
ncbi:MAG: cytochrome c-type biogenesis protein CcmH [Proteobacteria bacterium]|nr:cytochrome c-type biogenesis protein CcmH [Pseudomonadota bacterium]